MADEKKTGWDKADIVLKPVGGFLTALAVAFLGVYGSYALNQSQSGETKRRVYAELVSQREAADSLLRKDMFTSVLGKFLTPNRGNLEEQILQLELLAYNFHESLDLGPLFKDIFRRIDTQTPAGKEYFHRLEKVTKEVAGKQVSLLGGEGGQTRSVVVDFDRLVESPEGIPLINESLGLRPHCPGQTETDYKCRRFVVEVMDVKKALRELVIRLRVSPPGEPDGNAEVDALFRVGFFDFPMIDNTHLSHNQRCAVVLSRFYETGAEITLVYFPGFRAGLKDKPFVEDVIHEALRSEGAAHGGERK